MSRIFNDFSRIWLLLFVILPLGFADERATQQLEKIPASEIEDKEAVFYLHPPTSASEPQQIPFISQDRSRRRIVERGPRLYFLKRAINPITWLGEFSEAIFISTEKGRLRPLVERLSAPPKTWGFTPLFGGAGSGSGLGTGVRFFHKDVFGLGFEVEVPLLITWKDYRVAEFNMLFPLMGDERLAFDLRGAYRSRPQDKFFGIGNESSQWDKAEFQSFTREVLAGFSSKINEQWKTGLHLIYRDIHISDPIGVPSAQDVFDPAVAPGLRTGTELLSTVLTLENDTKDNKRIPSRGGFRQLEVSLNEGISRGDFSFWRYRLDLQHFIPLGSASRRILAFRGMFESNEEKGGSQIPFFELATLGGANTMRSLENFRYYDKSALAFLVEYRYRIWRAFDWVFFVEEGQVAPEPGDFGWSRFHTGYGARLFMRATPTLPLSIDIGHSREGWRFYFRVNPSF